MTLFLSSGIGFVIGVLTTISADAWLPRLTNYLFRRQVVPVTHTWSQAWFPRLRYYLRHSSPCDHMPYTRGCPYPSFSGRTPWSSNHFIDFSGEQVLISKRGFIHPQDGVTQCENCGYTKIRWRARWASSWRADLVFLIIAIGIISPAWGLISWVVFG